MPIDYLRKEWYTILVRQREIALKKGERGNGRNECYRIFAESHIGNH